MKRLYFSCLFIGVILLFARCKKEETFWLPSAVKGEYMVSGTRAHYVGPNATIDTILPYIISIDEAGDSAIIYENSTVLYFKEESNSNPTYFFKEDYELIQANGARFYKTDIDSIDILFAHYAYGIYATRLSGRKVN